MSTFLVAGSIAYDMLLSYDGSFVDGIDTERLEDLSVGYVTRHLVRHYGGTAANIAWNLALLGQEVYIAGSVGKDGDEYLERLREKGINISLVRKFPEHMSSTAIVGTDSDEHQITFFHPGADQESQGTDVSLLRGKLSHVIISPHSTTSMLQTALKCQEYKVPYIFDPGQQSLQFAQDDLRRVVKGSAGLVANMYEWSLLTEKLGWNAHEILSHTDFLIVTHGEHGLSIQTVEESIVVPAVPTHHLVNPTGAGDGLRAGLLTGLALQWKIEDACRLGAAMASFVVEVEGPQMEVFSVEEMYERSERIYGKRLPAIN